MPNLDLFEGLKVNAYNGEHPPPHLHFIYNEFVVLIVIETGAVYQGFLPIRQLKKALAWLDENAEWPLKVFFELNPI